MRYSGIQPQYFPRLHYFARILNTDIFALRDDVQFVREHKYPDGSYGKSYQAHTPIKNSDGVLMMTLPIRHGEGMASIKDTHISYDHGWDDWLKSMLKTIRHSYGKSKNYKEVARDIEMIMGKKYESLAGLDVATILWGIIMIMGERLESTEKLDVGYVNSKLAKNKKFRLRKIVRGSDILKDSEGMGPNDKILAICKSLGITEDYCGGTAMAAYMDTGLFEKNNIKITIQDWKCREYDQPYKKQAGFTSNLSVIDLLMSEDRETSLKILT